VYTGHLAIVHSPFSEELTFENAYGVATISRLLKITGFFCRISSFSKGSFAKETYNFKEPTNRSHPILLGWIDGVNTMALELTFENVVCVCVCVCVCV